MTLWGWEIKGTRHVFKVKRNVFKDSLLCCCYWRLLQANQATDKKVTRSFSVRKFWKTRQWGRELKTRFRSIDSLSESVSRHASESVFCETKLTSFFPSSLSPLGNRVARNCIFVSSALFNGATTVAGLFDYHLPSRHAHQLLRGAKGQSLTFTPTH